MMKFFKAEHHIPFMSLAKWAVRFSILMMILSVVLFFARGLNYGIDFRGGTEMKITVPETQSVGDVRGILTGQVKGELSVNTESGADAGMQAMKVRISSTGEEAALSEEKISALKTFVTTEIPDSEVKGVTSIGGAVSGELVTKGMLAIGLTLIAISIYIWLRFEWQFSFGAVIALAHDVTLTIGLFSLLQLTFDLSIVAAILAIIGYSLNDTVVVYDRIREKLDISKSEPIETVIDRGINETLRRTTMTSFTTIIAVAALYIFGGAELRGFSFAMLWGVCVGTYSSIFIASPILTYFGLDRADKPKSTTKFADIDA